MKLFLENIMDKFKPHFEKGGKLERFYPFYDATETFLYRNPVRTTKGAHVRDSFDLKRMMITVFIALMPCTLFGMYNIGYQHYLSIGETPQILFCFIKGFSVLIPLYIVTFVVGLSWEMLFAIVRKHEMSEGFFVTGALIPLIVPPTIPLWQVAIAISFGVVLGKELFGGTGMNIFNPALVTRAFLFFAYPGSISGNSVWVLAGDKLVDSFSMATPLSAGIESTGPVVNSINSSGYSFLDMFLGFIPGCIGETSCLAILLGALILLITGVASWRIIPSVFAGAFLMSFLLNFLSPSSASLMSIPPHYHFVMGGFAFGAVFMATDPVTGSRTKLGKYIYGMLIGILAILVRTFNPAYPEGIMLSILFMNIFAPLIDYCIVQANIKRRLKRAVEK